MTVHHKQRSTQAGFTIIELMIATTVFATLIAIASAVVIQISRQFYKGILSSRTQEVARTISEEISRGVQFSSTDPVVFSGGAVEGICLSGQIYYAFQRHKQLADDTTGDHATRVLIRQSGCPPTAPGAMPGSGGTEMLAKGMRIAKLSLTRTPDTLDTWNLSVRIVTGDGDLLTNNGDDAACRNDIGSQFCAASELNVTVFKRL